MNKVKDNILQHYKGYENLIKKLQQITDKYQKINAGVSLGFYSGNEIVIINSFLSDKIPYVFFGGYDDAVRKMCIVGENIDFKEYICCLSAEFNKKFNNLTHRDIKGAVFNSGIEPDKIGDMWVEEDKIYLYCCKDISMFLQHNLDRVKRCSVQFREVEFKKQTFRFEEYKYNISSLRLDKLVSVLIKKSREKQKKLSEPVL
ncbi:MAG: YlmH/Sll1252 family protein [Erysipelotrichaceae bacterium]